MRQAHSDPTHLLGQLETASLENLRALWRGHLGPPPKLRSKELLRLMLAWNIQTKTTGGLTNETKRKLTRKGHYETFGRKIGNGSILTRKWQNQFFDVIVEEKGFRYNGRIYRSLTAIAKEITGTHWNGPRFFGLRDRDL